MGDIFFMEKKIILIDGNNIINRAFYAVPLLSNDTGEFTNAVYGFLNIILKLYKDESPTHSIIAFDMPKATFRHEIFADYKINRKQSIFSGDTDLLQMADKNIKIFLPKNSKDKKKPAIEIYDYDAVLKKHEITPKEYIDVKALMGDKSDNVPGIRGIGQKNALKIIKQYKSIENAIIEIKKKKKRELSLQEKNLIENEEKALFYKKLICINTNVDVNIDAEQAELKNLFNDTCLKELKRLNLNSILSKVNHS